MTHSPDTKADRSGWDVHTHHIPRQLVDAARNEEFGLSLVDNRWIGQSYRVPLERIASTQLLTDWVRENNLSGALVSPPPPLFRPDLEGNERRRWIELVNDGLGDACTGELRPMAYLPVEDPRLAAEVAASLGNEWAGVTLGTDLRGGAYSDRSFDILWETLCDRKLPAFLHPGECPDDRLGVFYMGNLLGNPYETTLAAAHFVFGDVFSRFPDLQIILAHGGGATALLGGRWQRGATSRRPGLPELALSPLDALRHFYVDNLVHSGASLSHILEVFGTDKVLFGSDWPFPMGADSVEATLEGVGEGLAHRIRVTNAGPIVRNS